MQIDPQIIGRISAMLSPSAALADGECRIGIGAIDHEPTTLGLLATAQFEIPSNGSVHFDFRKLAMVGDSAARDAEGRTVAYNEIRCLAVHSTQPLAVTAGLNPWAASPLPQALRAQAITGKLLVFHDSCTVVITNPSETDAALVTFLSLGSNTSPGSLTSNGTPFTVNGVQFIL
jgi:hypothetical protein